MVKDDGTHLVIDAKFLHTTFRYFLGFVLALFASVGTLIHENVNGPTRGDYELVTRGQEDIRREVRYLQARVDSCERHCRNSYPAESNKAYRSRQKADERE